MMITKKDDIHTHVHPDIYLEHYIKDIFKLRCKAFEMYEILTTTILYEEAIKYTFL